MINVARILENRRLVDALYTTIHAVIPLFTSWMYGYAKHHDLCNRLTSQMKNGMKLHRP